MSRSLSLHDYTKESLVEIILYLKINHRRNEFYIDGYAKDYFFENEITGTLSQMKKGELQHILKQLKKKFSFVWIDFAYWWHEQKKL